MTALERRIRDLESSAPQGDPRAALIGAPPIDFSKSYREAAFRVHGFDLERIESAAECRIREPGAVVRLDYDKVRADVEAESRLREQLKGLSHTGQEALARREGYRIVYPGNGTG